MENSDPNLENQPSNMNVSEPFKPKKNNLPIILLSVVLVLVLGFAVVFAFKDKLGFGGDDSEKTGVGNNNSGTSVVVTQDPFNFPPPVPYASSTETGYPNELPMSPRPAFSCSSTTVSTKKVNGEIAWQKPEKVASSTIFSSGNPFYGQPDYYKLGHFVNGGYAGADLYLVAVPCDGMCFSDTYYYMVKKADKLAVLQKEYVGGAQFNPIGQSVPGVGLDTNYSISDKVFPNSIKGPNGQILNITPSKTFKNFCADDKQKLFSDPEVGDVYIDKVKAVNDANLNYGFYVQAPDGSQVDYTVDVPFISQGNVPQIVWINGQKNTDEYGYTDRTGCGSFNYVSVVPESKIKPSSDLVQSGTTINGDAVWELKNPQHPFLKDFYENVYYPNNGEPKISYAQFVKIHPVFFWKDSFNRLIKFQKSTLLAMAECGKPVIYLYPETTQKVSVNLKPEGGFSYTEPAYNNGWSVIAEPNGNLTNISDNKQYPYLFWEGRGGIYQTPEKGFVIKQSEVTSFLKEKLAKLGLNEKESTDFREFWEPKMQNSPYYFVTFLGNGAMDAIAPLSVTPKPESVIRILMDFKPLNRFEKVEGYNIATPKRTGFTVVEWGGVLRGK